MPTQDVLHVVASPEASRSPSGRRGARRSPRSPGSKPCGSVHRSPFAAKITV
jgi:hypothetical protein